MTRSLSTVLVERVLDVLRCSHILLALALSSTSRPEVARALDCARRRVLRHRHRHGDHLDAQVSGAIADRTSLAPGAPAARPKLRSMADSALDGFAASPTCAPRRFSSPTQLPSGSPSGSSSTPASRRLTCRWVTARRCSCSSRPRSVSSCRPRRARSASTTPSSSAVLVNVFDIDKESAVSFTHWSCTWSSTCRRWSLGPLFLWTERGLWQRASFLDKLRQLRGAPVADADSSNVAADL